MRIWSVHTGIYFVLYEHYTLSHSSSLLLVAPRKALAVLREGGLARRRRRHVEHSAPLGEARALRVVLVASLPETVQTLGHRFVDVPLALQKGRLVRLHHFEEGPVNLDPGHL